jgi:adenylate kinase
MLWKLFKGLGIIMISYNCYSMNQSQSNYVIIGPPGSGKGTLSQALLDVGYEKIASGDILREEVKKNSEIGLLIKKKIEKGELISDECIWSLVQVRILQSIFAKQPFVLDGFPQTVGQYNVLSSFIREHNLNNSITFIFIEIDKETALARMTSRITCLKCNRVYNLISNRPTAEGRCDFCGDALYKRKEDNLADASKRIDVFFQKTQPILKLSENEFRFLKLDGNYIKSHMNRFLDTLVKGEANE